MNFKMGDAMIKSGISELAIADNTDDGFVSEIKKGCEYYTSFEVVEHTRLELVTFRLPV